MCVQVTKTANRFEISSLLEKILLKQVRWCLTFVGVYITEFLRKQLLKHLKKNSESMQFLFHTNLHVLGHDISLKLVRT